MIFKLIGKALALPVRLANIPMRAAEKLIGDIPEEDRIISKPLDDLADAIEEACDDDS